MDVLKSLLKHEAQFASANSNPYGNFYSGTLENSDKFLQNINWVSLRKSEAKI